ncbi:MAG: ABC transporter permease [Sphingobacteriales bacterium]
MFRNYILTAFRNFARNKAFSLINIAGLAIGISAALVIFIIVYYEFSFDRFEKDGNRIYRVVLDAKFNGSTEAHTPAVPAPLSSAVQNEVTGIDMTVPIIQFHGGDEEHETGPQPEIIFLHQEIFDATSKVSVVDNSGKPVIYKKQPHIVFTNEQYFKLLPYQWIAGSHQTALKDPFTVVLTENRAQLYFPDVAASDIIGKQVTYNGITVTVSGIVKDLNENTSFVAAEFISFPTIEKTHLQDQFKMNMWDDWIPHSQLFIKLSKGNTAERTAAQLNDLLEKYNMNADKESNNTMAFHLQPLNDLHFNSNYPGIGQRIAHKPTLYGLLAIATFLLLLGCINYINLSTAHASRRAKEIGIRKTVGGSKKHLILQFLSETFFITVIATILSVVLIPVLLKMFVDFIPQGLQFDLSHKPALILFLVLLTIAVTFLSGLYPALILSGYKPVLVLKNQVFANAAQSRLSWIRKSLTVFQFVIAQFFIIATIMVSKQIKFSLNADMGFKKDAIITFDAPGDTVAAHRQLLLNTIKAIPEIELASTGFFSAADEGVAFSNISYNEKNGNRSNVQIRWGDPDYLDVYQIKLLTGKNVGPSDTLKEFIINETYAKILGFQKPGDALGKQLTFNGKNLPIIGVMHDFHYQSMHTLIGPLVFGGSNGSTFHIRLKPNTGGAVWQSAISKIRKAYRQIYHGADFEYKFIDDAIAKFYESERHTSSLLQWAAGLMIFISCLGLLGLVMYTISTRTKEIGIRKILGASFSSIISLLSTDFIRLVFIAFLIAAPLAWWVTYKWLENFAYKTSMSWWVFILGGTILLLAALITLSAQVIKTASGNPVKSLRTE